MIDVFLEYNKITDNLSYFGNGVYLKMIVDLDNKNSTGGKVPAIAEYRIPSNKYNNTDFIITAKRKFKYYLAIEYPNPYEDSEIKVKSIPIYTYSIYGLLEKMKEFDKEINKAFAIKKNKLVLLSDSITSVKSYPSYDNIIEFTQDIYYRGVDKDIPDLGVKMILNNEYEITFPAKTVWKSFLYLIDKSDLYGWASTMVSGYSARITGSNIVELDVTPNTDIHKPKDANNDIKSDTKIKKTKPISDSEKKRSFFDD